MPDDWQSIVDFVSDCPEPGFNFAGERLRSKQAERTSSLHPPLQLLTPPESLVDFSQEEPDNEDIMFSVSTAFFLSANKDSSPPDMILVSSDSVLFCVHSRVLLNASKHIFNSMLRQHLPEANGPLDLPMLQVSEASPVLNIILHTIYAAPCAQYSPSFEVLNAAVTALEAYGVPIRLCVAPSTPLFAALLSQTPHFPIEVYALAAHYDLYDLAVQVSSHLLSFPLPFLTDEMAGRIGPVYLKRLFFLHIRLVESLKRILLPSPHHHPPTAQCGFNEQKQLGRAWALASAYLMWDSRPDLSIGQMDSALGTLQVHMSCELCREMLANRIKHLTEQWLLIERTI